ncbi:beta-lactamase [Pseudomonas coronafaciens pv. porri]|uniref:Beta-lactamase n=1 Tax=Pseudomonas coronafaciens pv. porri TaxID=83964 RepID=A0ABR5JKI1_9PSED|nr:MULTISPECIES: serine hydrolase [Pseudomonas syringae group]KOP54353.1 beta-lactamase [Pseudomonas coronafaciens pv. porri]KOP54697.1 beta-lactamase [Pseudomonas coronafaciens pv. porri]KPY27946.1 Hydrolase [Pseudomonas coronafaciens pv. porri]MCQ3015734.1 beta-lactamase family protein [Pseudomonas tremae]QGL55764.1 serine hydrolase [Pseudomonas coronafaciens pv. oryzae str. 1_6]
MPLGTVRLSLFLLLCLGTQSVIAETWPAEQWSSRAVSPAPAIEALDTYAFPPRDDEARKGIRTDALLVIRDGEVVYEHYAGVTTEQTPHLTWSISKSIMATVLGVAFTDGRFQLNDPVAKFYAPFEKHPDITIKHMMNWASGLDWQEDYEYAPLNSSVVAMLYTRGRDDMAHFTADHPAARPPGKAYLYSSGDSNVLAAALKTMVGQPAYADYPWTALFDPLGIHSAVWETDGSGTFVGSSYAYMTARDLARIGLLMQRGGEWQGRQLLNKEWLGFVLTPFAGEQVDASVEVPGGQWWLNRTLDGGKGPWPDAPPDTFAALGHWGQALYVIPSQKLVIVRYADDRDGTYNHDQMLKLLLAAFGKETGQ